MQGDVYVNQLDCDNHFTVYMYIKTSCFTHEIYTSFVCQLYHNKAGDKKQYGSYLR